MANQDKKNEDDTKINATGKRDESGVLKDKDKIQERLGFGLRSMYRSVLEEPLPEDMMALLEQLDDGNSDNKPAASPEDID